MTAAPAEDERAGSSASGVPVRLFVAVEVPEAVGLSRLVAAEPVRGLRWVAVDRLHCTLVFAGRVRGELVGPAVRAAECAARSRAPLRCRLTGRVDRFGAAVLWAEVEPRDDLVALARDLEERWRAAGLEVDDRELRPHVTLARRGRARVDDAACAAVAGRTAEWTAERLAVIESRPAGSGPPRWRTLARPRLEAAAPGT